MGWTDPPDKPAPPTTSAAGYVLRPRTDDTTSPPPAAPPPVLPPPPDPPPLPATGTGQRPPPPRSAGPAFPTPGPRVRKIASIVAAAAACVLALVWLQTFFPAPPITSAGTALVLLPVVIPVLLVAALVANSRQRRDRRTPSQALPLTGWRRKAYMAASVFLLITVATMILSGPDGSPERQGDRYYLDTRDDLVEISETTWRQAEARSLRFLACVVLLLSLIHI